MKMPNIFINLILTGLITLSGSFFNIIKAQNLNGTYILIKDNDGTTPKEGARITLDLNNGHAHITAVMGEEKAESPGSYTVKGSRITMQFDEYDFSCKNAVYTLTGNTLILPFAVFEGEKGTSSEWQRQTGKNDRQGEENGGGKKGGDDGKKDDGGKGNNGGAKGGDDGGKTGGDGTRPKPGDGKGKTTKGGEGEAQKGPYSQYAGKWIGNGFGWEVRFKQTAGDFASQFSGVKKGDLPFENEKVIMSLMVQHSTVFDLDIDAKGNITGEGVVVYDLIPNLCGVAALTESVNKAINMMDKIALIHKLGADIGNIAAKDVTEKFLGLEGNMAKAAMMGKEAVMAFGLDKIGDELLDAMKSLDISHAQREMLCRCVAGDPKAAAGSKVGPATLDELIASMGPDVAKGVFDALTLSLPVGLMLSIPGVTQVQYYYKGLVNGPEMRRFKVTGYLQGDKMYLTFGDLMGGSKDLKIEWMVNYKKETATFPTWSPFLKAPANLHPEGEMTVVQLEEYTEVKEVKDPKTGKKTTISIPRTRKTEEKVRLNSPFATFSETGTKRNNVSVWHEYEYYWSAFKVENP